MLNFQERSKDIIRSKIRKTPYIIWLFSFISLAWCWGENWWENINNTSTQPISAKSTSSQPTLLKWKVQAWIISWATVNIINPKTGNILLTVTTDENWNYQIDQEVLKVEMTLDGLDFNNNPNLLLESTGWMDIDPDDDWDVDLDDITHTDYPIIINLSRAWIKIREDWTLDAIQIK